MQNESATQASFLVHNGILCDATAARPAMTDGALIRGQGAFETLAAYRGKPFLVSAHLDRLRHTAEVLDLICPPDADLIEAMKTVLRVNGLAAIAKVRIRITLTSPPQGESWFVEASLPPEHKEDARVITIPYVRNERGALTGLKTINYGENVVALKLARASGADEVLFGNTRDELCEGAWANVFVCLSGRIITPPLSSGCLPGVTRAAVIDLSRDLGFGVAERAIPMAELPMIDGAFFTSSLREIQWISRLNGRDLAEPPPLATLKPAFRALVAHHLDKTAT